MKAYSIDQSNITGNAPLPIIHLNAQPAALWGEQGIYSNALLDREIPASLRLCLPGGALCIKADIQLKIHGGFREDVLPLYRKSFAVRFSQRSTSAHDDDEIFTGVTWGMLEGLLLRNPGTDASLLRDVLLAAICAEWEVDLPAHRFCILNLNGQYWGVYNLCEKISRSFLKRHADDNSVDFDLIEFKDEPDPIVILGDVKHYDDMIRFLRDGDVSTTDSFRQISSLLDVDSFIDWQIAEIYAVNLDWPQNNVMLWRSRLPGGKWRWILFDADAAFGLWDYSKNGHIRDHLAYAMGRGATEVRPPAWSTFLDETANKHLAEIHGDVVWEAKSAPVRKGGSVSLNGTDAYLLIAEAGFSELGQAGSAYTVEAWIKTTKEGLSPLWNGTTIFEKRAVGGAAHQNRVFTLYLNGDDSIGLHFEKPQEDIEAKTPVNDNQWRHIAGVRDQDKAAVYIDGKLAADGTIQDTDKSSPEQPFTIGCRRLDNDGTKCYFPGLVDEVVVYSRALTPAEIQQDMNQGVLAVSSVGKLATTWGNIKSQ